MGKPGHRDFPLLGRKDECVRASFCCVTGLNPIQVPFIQPTAVDIEDFWLAWHNIAFDLGFELEFIPDGTWFHPEEDELWIAVVPSLQNPNGRAAHAIVMKGERIHYEPAEERQLVREIIYAFRVKPVAR